VTRPRVKALHGHRPETEVVFVRSATRPEICPPPDRDICLPEIAAVMDIGFVVTQELELEVWVTGLNLG